MAEFQGPSIGIIGYGRFGRLLHEKILDNSDISIYDIATKELNSDNNFDSVAACELIFLCVPIVKLNETLQKLSKRINLNATVMDVLSVKEYAYEQMLQILPESVGILPTHPMFGPDSARNGVNGLPFVLCPEKRTPVDVLSDIRSLLEAKGLKVIEMSCEEHDKITAKSLCLTQLIGRLAIPLELQESEIDTQNFKNVLKMRDTAANDSLELFVGLQRYNRHAKKTRQIVLDELKNIEKVIETYQ